MKIKNRISRPKADYLFLIVRQPPGWSPTKLDSIPPDADVLSVDYVASFDEACDDLVRCNKLAMQHGLRKWAVVQSAGGDM